QAIEIKGRLRVAAALSWAPFAEINMEAGPLGAAIRAGEIATPRAAKGAPGTDDQVMARVGAIWCRIGDVDRGQVLAHKAQDALAGRDRLPVRFLIHQVLGNCCSLRGEAAEGLAQLEKATMIARDMDDVPKLQSALTDRSAAQVRAGLPEAALATAEQARQTATAASGPLRSAVVQTQYARALHTLGRTTEALDLLHPAYQTFRRSRVPLKRAETAAALGAIYLSRGNLIYFCHYLDDCINAFEMVTEDLQDEQVRNTFLRDPRRREVFDMIEQAKH
nr:hypothetical protein [PVC group bacterium]